MQRKNYFERPFTYNNNHRYANMCDDDFDMMVQECTQVVGSFRGRPKAKRDNLPVKTKPAELVIMNPRLERRMHLNPMYDPESDTTYIEQVYICNGVIGIGTYGTVIGAINKFDRKKCAIKLFERYYPGYNKRFTEVANWEKVGNHKYCVQYFYSWQQNGTLYTHLEYCQENLRIFNSKMRGLSPEHVWDVLCDMLFALKHLHNKQLVHRDIKPDNIMITREGLHKLGDFGLLCPVTKQFKSDSSTPVNIFATSEGDGKYLASETLEGVITKTCDIFSLSMTLIELALYLDLPTGGDEWHNLRRDVFPDELNKLPTDLGDILRKMLAGNYTKRPSVQALLNIKSVKCVLQTRRKGLRRNFWLEHIQQQENEEQITKPFNVNVSLPLPECGHDNPQIQNPEENPTTPPRGVSQVRIFKE